MHDSNAHEPDKADIELLAYRLWIESGRVRGHDREHWQAARQMLLKKSVRPVRLPAQPATGQNALPAPISGGALFSS